MKHLKLILAIVISLVQIQFCISQDWANLARFQEDNENIMNKKSEEPLIVFMGNSITEVWSSISPEFWEGQPFVNRGISGQTTPQMLVRFRLDVVRLRPSKVVIMAGINDIAGNTGPTTIQAIANNVFSMVEIADANNIEVLLCSVLPAFDFLWSPGLLPAPKVVELNKLLKTYAANNGHTYIDYHSAMKDSKDGLRKGLGDDGVHPNKDGYNIMENILLPYLR